MDTFKISINKIHKADGSETYERYDIRTNRGREHLITVYPSQVSEDLWYFVIPENNAKQALFITSEQFPVDYLLKLCKAVITIRYGVVYFDVSLTVKAKKTLGIK